LSRQSFCAPFHLSKPHVDADCLVVNIVNPTAGLFDGDEVELAAHVESDAKLILTTPSASRIYHSRSGKPAIVRQRVSVENGGFVEFIPEPIIPQAGAIYHQQTTLEAATGAEMIFFEWLTPGRVASGEVFAYRQLNWETEVRWNGNLVAKERYRLNPTEPETLAALTTKFPQAHYLGCFFLTDLKEPARAEMHLPRQPGYFPVAEIEALENASIYLGWSALTNGGYVIKALCADSLSTRKLLGNLRRVLYTAFGKTMPSLGRF
jgi:urease accessory protein